MRPFRKIMILEYGPIAEIGIYGQRVTTSPWKLKIKINDWWGLRERVRYITVKVPFDSDPWKFYEERLNKWI